MCVAIVQPKAKPLTDAILTACWQANPDGAGFAYIKDGKVVIDTGYSKLQAFLNAYRPIADEFNPQNAMLVHFRIRSAGTVSAENCHPFPVKGGAMIHNGTLFYPKSAHGDKSDTKVFAEQLYDGLTLENVRAIKTKLASHIGSYNKLAFLYDTGDYEIVNEAQGIYHQGAWFSNNYWQSRV